MSIEKKLLGTTPVSGAVDPEGVSFDGTNDYLSRSSDLSGNADGKTFTFSAFVYSSDPSSYQFIYNQDAGGNPSFSVFITSSGGLYFVGRNSSGTTILEGQTPNATISANTWTHILLSFDLSSTSNRYIYVNDTLVSSPTWTTYTNDNIDFTQPNHDIALDNGTNSYEGRLSHLFLDYTYRDLSVTANRRLFIDSDGQPSDTIPSSPILYLPMTDAATAGSNSGTGGDFTVNGVLDTAGRGANQYNCAASEFDGSADYLSRSSIAGISDGKEFTFSCAFRGDALDNKPFISIEGGGNQYFFIRVSNGGSYKYLTMGAYNTSTTYILNYTATDIKMYNGVNYSLQISIDMTDEAKSKVVVNGEVKTLSAFAIFSNQNIDFTHSNYGIGAVPLPNYHFNGSIGELYFDDSYTNLSTDNPFWDADANRPKPVRQVISETGTTPLIALPLRGDDAGNNLGTGGDFTVNSGPYTGARGGSEYWARSAEFDGSTGSLKNTSVTMSNSKTFTLAFAVQRPASENVVPFSIVDAEDVGYADDTLSVHWNSNGAMYLSSRNTSGTHIIDANTSASYTATDTWYVVLISVDTNTASNRHFYVNGTSDLPTWGVTVNAALPFSSNAYCAIAEDYDGIQGNSSVQSFTYFSTDYIDFSQESNRNLFVDQLGYPKDLTPAIDAGDIADPLIYMKFDDTSDLGANSGTGGDFTVNGTVDPGADIDPNA